MYSNYNPDEVMNIQEEIVKWAEKYVPEFNKLSEKYNTSYYTQSPLNCIDGEVDLMLIGINPKGILGMGQVRRRQKSILQEILIGQNDLLKRVRLTGNIIKEQDSFWDSMIFVMMRA